MTEKILIVGSSGPISVGLAMRFAERAIVVGRGESAQRYFDLEDSHTFRALEDIEARHAVFLSALTGFQPCEDDTYRAFRTNVRQTAEAVEILNRNGIPVTYISSSAVFGKTDMNRDEQANSHPESVYGRTKRLTELQVLRARSSLNSVVRLTKLVDKDLPILKRWRARVQTDDSLVARQSLRLAPLPLSFVVDHLRKVIAQKITGVTHVTSDKDLSYYELAQALFPQAQVAPEEGDAAEHASAVGSSALAVRHPDSSVFGLAACIEEIRKEIADGGRM